MTKVTKRIVAILATTMLLIGMAMPVGAAVSQPNTGTITVHKYVRDSAATPHPDNQYSGDELTGAQLAGLGTPTNGVGFTLFDLDMTAVNAKLAAGHNVTGYTVNGETSVDFHFDEPSTVNAPVISDMGGEKTTATVGGVDGIASWGTANLPDGYYLLVETTPLAGYTPAASSVIRLPLTKADGTDANRNVHVYPKNINENPTIIEKKVNGSLNVLKTGDVVPFKITALFQNVATGDEQVISVEDLKKTDGTDTNYGLMAIYDDLESYFKQVNVANPPTSGTANDVRVYLVDGAGNEITTTTLSAPADYTLTQTPGTAGAVVRIDLTTSGIDKAIAATPRATGLVMTFDAEYVGGASAAITGTTIFNTGDADIVAARPVTGPSDPPPVEPPVTPPPAKLFFPKAQVEVTKHDEEGALFAGATFALAKVSTPTKNFDAAEWAAATPAEKTTLAATYAPMYVCDVDGKPITVTTTATGKAFFNDVPYADAAVSYYLKEISTQAGYELPVGTFEVKFLARSAYTAEQTNGQWNEGAVIKSTGNAVIVNSPKGTDKTFSLPLTGGTGTVIFTIVGIVLMAGAVAIYLRGKKKNA